MDEPIIIIGKFNKIEKIIERFTINSFVGLMIIDSPEAKAIDRIHEELKNINENIQK